MPGKLALLLALGCAVAACEGTEPAANGHRTSQRKRALRVPRHHTKLVTKTFMVRAAGFMTAGSMANIAITVM